MALVQEIWGDVSDNRWLEGDEVWRVLQDTFNGLILTNPAIDPRPPQHGAIFVINKNVLRDFRDDGRPWPKRSGRPRSQQETRMKSGVNGLQRYDCLALDDSGLMRRVYWIPGDNQRFALIQYRDDLVPPVDVPAPVFPEIAADAPGIAADPPGIAADPSGIAADPSGIAADPPGIAAAQIPPLSSLLAPLQSQSPPVDFTYLLSDERVSVHTAGAGSSRAGMTVFGSLGSGEMVPAGVSSGTGSSGTLQIVPAAVTGSSGAGVGSSLPMAEHQRLAAGHYRRALELHQQISMVNEQLAELRQQLAEQHHLAAYHQSRASSNE